MAPGEDRQAMRGDALLLSHLAAVSRMTREEGGRGRARLEAELGADTARRLIDALSGRLRATRPQTPLAFP